jgi:hypothetical protein
LVRSRTKRRRRRLRAVPDFALALPLALMSALIQRRCSRTKSTARRGSTSGSGMTAAVPSSTPQPSRAVRTHTTALNPPGSPLP